jgi:lactate dehydrogenase-like 2-hydroxyacid dehydrogenase
MGFNELPKINDDAKKVIAIDPDFCNWNIPNNALDILNLKAVCLNTTSYSWINLDYTKIKNISVTNVRHWSTDSVAEKGLSLALNLAIKLPLLLKNKMEIDFTTMRGVELRWKTAGVIGMGHIGKRIAELCQAMDMKVVYWSKNSTDNRFNKCELADLFTNSDVIFPALLKNKETETLITNEHLNSMQKKW